MREFGVEVATGDLVALERALRGLDTDAARSALTKAHRTSVVLMAREREAVLAALRVVLGDSPVADAGCDGLARLASKLKHEQETTVDERPPSRRASPTKN